MGNLWLGVFSIIGVLVGVGINEVFRRRRRIEVYAARFFDERLAKYAELIHLLHSGYEVASDVMKNPDYSAGERHEMISGVVLSIAQFSDENELFVNEELSVHCSTVFMGAEEVYGIEDVAKREKRKAEILESYVLARKMI